MKTFKSYMNEDIKGWKNAHTDIMKIKKAASDASKSVHLHRLTAAGKESGLHDARKPFKSEKEARDHHSYILSINPGKKISHNLYVDNKLVTSLNHNDK